MPGQMRWCSENLSGVGVSGEDVFGGMGQLLAS